MTQLPAVTSRSQPAWRTAANTHFVSQHCSLSLMCFPVLNVLPGALGGPLLAHCLFITYVLRAGKHIKDREAPKGQGGSFGAGKNVWRCLIGSKQVTAVVKRTACSPVLVSYPDFLREKRRGHPPKRRMPPLAVAEDWFRLLRRVLAFALRRQGRGLAGSSHLPGASSRH